MVGYVVVIGFTDLNSKGIDDIYFFSYPPRNSHTK